ncbi:MAG: VOC family protein [Anaerolineaceae bacterium]|nr:VOC family protein [Anaerolineaceae bacterium]
MLSDFEVTATIPVSDLQRARKFYAEKLGLRPVQETPGGLLYQCRNSHFFMYPTSFAGTAQNTAAGWEVDHIEREVNDLRSKGIKFEEYDMPGLKTIEGIATMGKDKGAWFKDSEGNILSLIQRGK